MAEPKNRAERRAAERKVKGGTPPQMVIRTTRRTGDDYETMLKHMAKQSEKNRTQVALRSKQVKGY